MRLIITNAAPQSPSERGWFGEWLKSWFTRRNRQRVSPELLKRLQQKYAKG